MRGRKPCLRITTAPMEDVRLSGDSETTFHPRSRYAGSRAFSLFSNLHISRSDQDSIDKGGEVEERLSPKVSTFLPGGVA